MVLLQKTLTAGRSSPVLAAWFQGRQGHPTEPECECISGLWTELGPRDQGMSEPLGLWRAGSGLPGVQGVGVCVGDSGKWPGGLAPSWDGY